MVFTPTRRVPRRALLAAACALVLARRPAAAQEIARIRLASTHVLTYAPLLLAKELGYYAAEGLDVDLLETQSSTATASALLGGSVVAGGSGFNQPLLLAEQGKRVKTLVGLEMSSIYVFVVGPAISVAADDPAALAAALKGRRIGVAGLGSPGHLIAEGVLAAQGVAGGQAAYVAIGTGATALAAFRAGAVDAMITYEPDLSQVLETGAGRIALDLRRTRSETTFSRLPTSSLQATAEWVDANPDVAARLVRAVARANRTLRDDPATSVAALAKLYPAIAARALQSMYEASREHFQSAVTVEQYEQALATYLKTRLVTKPVPYESAVAAQFAPLWR